MDDNARNDCFMSNALCLSLPAAVWEYLSWLQFLVRRMEIQRNALKSKRRHTHTSYFASLPVFCGADLSVFKYFLSVINHHVWACKWLFVIMYGKTWKSNKSCGHTCAEKKRPWLGSWKVKSDMSSNWPASRSGWWWYANWSLTSASYKAGCQPGTGAEL